ncbi:MAG: GIY-YIG nuclease family protein [Candidatus Moranbacteria bacterium]|nr:GIY-YIG nuclease family protein [Candidatus Moranbacteria bacterium]
MSWYTYIAQAKTGRYYTGITNDPLKRIEKHNTGEGARMAIEQGPFELVYVSNVFPGKSEARKREAQIKGWSREKKEKLIHGEWK